MNGFEIRWAEESDRPAIISAIRDTYHGDDEYAKMAEFFTSPLHAYARPETACIAVDKTNGKVAGVEITVPMTWLYEGISLKTNLLLLTGTPPEYRGQKVMNLIHDYLGRYFIENKYDLSFVDGIPWYYRRHGYYPLPLLPDMTDYDRFTLPDGNEKINNYIFRPLEKKDLSFTVELLSNKAKDMLYSFTYDEKWVRMFGLDYYEEVRDLSTVVCDLNHEPLGVIFGYTKNCNGQMLVLDFVLKHGVSYLDATPAVMEFLAREGDKQMGVEGGCKHITMPYDVNTQEVLYDCMSRTHYANKRQCRLTDAALFIKKIAPVLEKRIEESPIYGYTKKVGLQLFGHDKDLYIIFDKGKIVETLWEKANFVSNSLDIQMPYEKFIRLLFGVDMIDELRHEHREVNTHNGERLSNEMRLLLKVLFPKKLSYIMHSC